MRFSLVCETPAIMSKRHDNREMNDALVVEIARRGRLAVGIPFFEPGVPVPIDRRGIGDAGPGDLAVVTRGNAGRRARLERVLGRADRIETVLDGLLVSRGEHGADEPYDWPTPTTDGRVDLQELPTITIDPETARDFDDAISVRRDCDALRAHVHIADVSHFVRAGTPLDNGAADRGFSVYVPGRVAPMLPFELADDLCSLRPHQDRLALTVEVPFGSGLTQGEATFYRSVIRSDARLTYGQAERMLAGSEGAPPAVSETLLLAERLAGELRRRRYARGALRVETPEVAFAFDGEGGVERAWLEAEPHAHMLVEELMILANEAVAALLASRQREALYRVHEPPDPRAIARLIAMLADLEVPTPPAPDLDALTPSAASTLAAEISERVTDYVGRSGRGSAAFPPLVLQALRQARYDPANLGHSGLASTAYCHFTSPIRRYPDLVCHRALLRELGASDEPLPEDIDLLAANASEREREAADVEYAADEICLAWLLQRTLFERGWDEPFAGEITGVIASGLFVRFDRVYEGYLPARALGDDYYELNALGTGLSGRRTGRSYRLGDPVEVRVVKVDRADGKVQLEPATRARLRPQV
jgi:ribonuclease R